MAAELRQDGGRVSPAAETAMTVDALRQTTLILDPLDNAQRYRVLAALTVLFGVHLVREDGADG